MRDYFPLVQQIALAIPGVEQTISHGGIIFKIRHKFLTSVKDDGVTLVLRTGDMVERDIMIETEPEIFYITEHYRRWCGLLVRLPTVSDDEVRLLIERAWRTNAPKKLVREYDGTP